jgi:hypothetical protein
MRSCPVAITSGVRVQSGYEGGKEDDKMRALEFFSALRM